MSAFAWDGLMRLGLTHLRLDPDVFWRLTPVELMLMAGIEGQDAPSMSRDGFHALAAQFPDTNKEMTDGRD